MQHHILITLSLVAGLIACKKISPTRPVCDTQYVDIPQDTSYLSTPLVIPTQLIEDKINESIGQNIVEDDDFENPNKAGEKDKLKLKITRIGAIQVTWKDNKASYQAPLQVLIERELVSNDVLPFPKSLAVKTEFSLRLVFETTVNLGEDWKLQPQSRFVSFQWLSDVKILGGLIDIKKMVERRILREMPIVLKKLDATIRAKVRLDRVMNRIWQNVQKPMIINRKAELVWLKIKPIRFEMGTITTKGDTLMVQGRLSATTETLLGDNPVYTIDSTLPPLLRRAVLPNYAYVYMLSEIPYKDINEVVAQKLTGKAFTVSGHTIKVKDAEVWGCGENLILHLKVNGGVKGDIYFKGTPRYEPDSQRIVIQNFDFEVNTQETLVASADWLLHDTFKEQMKAALSIPLLEKIDKIPQAIEEGIERGKVGQKMDFSIEQWTFRPQQIWVRPSDIAVLIIVNARVRVELEKI